MRGSTARSLSSTSAPARAELDREVEHRTLARADLGLAVVGGELVGEARILRTDAQDGAMGDDAVQALAGAEVATTIISRSALLRPTSFSIRASW